MLVCCIKTWTLRAEREPKAHLVKSSHFPEVSLGGETKIFIKLSELSEDTVTYWQQTEASKPSPRLLMQHSFQ